MKIARQSFLRQRQAACIIQMTYRTVLMKRNYIHFRQSVIKIQSFVRCKIMRSQFTNLKNSAVLIQRKFRTVKLGLEYRQAFLQLRRSAIIIQKYYRTFKAQIINQKEQAHQHFSATKIQAVYRGWSRRQDYLLLRAAAVCLQRRFRSHLAGQAVRNKVQRMREAVVIIQKKWRLYKLVQEAVKRVQCRKNEIEANIKEKLKKDQLEHERKVEMAKAELERRVEGMRKKRAALILLKHLQANMILKDHARRERAAIIIQKNIRGYQSRLRYCAELKKISQLQRVIRGFVCRRRFEIIKLAVRIIQTRWREIREGRRCYTEFITKREAVIKIQAQFLMIKQRRIYQYNIKRIIIVQACVRAFIHRNRFEKIMKGIVELQRRVRSKQQTKKDRERFLKFRHSAIKIQALVRLWIAHRQMQRETDILKTQTHVRTMHQQRAAYYDSHTAVQTQISVMEMNWQQLDTKAKAAAVVSHQISFYRYFNCQTQTKDLAARIIQRTVQKFLTKCSQEKKTAALIIQRALTRYVLRRKMIKIQYVVRIQTSIRQFLCRHNYLAKLRSIVVIQTAIRGWHARRLSTALRRRHQAAVCLQAGIRGFIVRKKLSSVLKDRLCALQEQNRQNRASIRIQALWRGFVTRRSTENRKLLKARKRLQDANRRATIENTLGSRTSSALDYLLREKDLAHILEALMHLEVSTRLSPKCCEKMVEVNAVSVLYRLINSCNRSVPHMELIKYSVNILLNLAKYEKTIAAVLEPQESVSCIVELLQIYREKGAIFNNCCMLLGILGFHPGRRMQILRNPLIVDRLQSIHALAHRKQRKQQNRQVTQAKMAAMRSFSCTLPVLTPSKSKSHCVRPDWILAGNNVKDFEDSVAAVTFVMDALQIQPKI